MTWWEKTKEFCKEHKVAIVAILSGLGGALGGALIFKASTPNPVELEQPETVKELTPETKTAEDGLAITDPMLVTIIGYEDRAREGGNFWTEDWRDNWDKVKEFANGLDSIPGEYYVLEGLNPERNKYNAEWFIHHWIDEHPCYPSEMVPKQEGE